MLPEQLSSAEGKGRKIPTALSCDFDPKLGSEVFNYGGEGRSREEDRNDQGRKEKRQI